MPTNEQEADMLTKVLPVERFDYFRNKNGVAEIKYKL